MPDISLSATTLTVLVVLTLALYAVIIIVFIAARQKYKGGVIGQVIQLMIAFLGFFLLADLALLLIPISGFPAGYISHIVLKICAMTCLAFGALKLFAG